MNCITTTTVQRIKDFFFNKNQQRRLQRTFKHRRPESAPADSSIKAVLCTPSCKRRYHSNSSSSSSAKNGSIIDRRNNQTESQHRKEEEQEEEREKVEKQKEQRPWKRYSLDVRLASGAYGVVWKSFDSVQREVVALKVIKLDDCNDTRVSCTTENKYWKLLEHDNIVRWKSEYVDVSLQVTALQYCNGGDLYDVSERPFSEPDALHVVDSVLKAVSYLHTIANVVHRDVKQENILIHYEDVRDTREIQHARILLTDFTFVAPVSPSMPYKTTFRKPCGTIPCMAPEMALGQKYTAKVDCWAVGVLAFELLQNMSPFDDFELPCPAPVLHNVFASRKPLDRSTKSSTLSAINALLCTNAEKRATAAEALKMLSLETK